MNIGTMKHAVILILSLLRWLLTRSQDIWNFHQAFFCFFLETKSRLAAWLSSSEMFCVQVWSRTPATCATMLAGAGTTWRPTWTDTTPRDVTSAICAAKSSNPKSHWKATDWATQTKVQFSLKTRFFLFALFWNLFCLPLSEDCWVCILNPSWIVYKDCECVVLVFLPAQGNGSNVQSVTSPQSPGRLCSDTWSSTLSLRYSFNKNTFQQESV